MKVYRPRRMPAALATAVTTVAAAGGLLLIAPAAHANVADCGDSVEIELHLAGGAYICDPVWYPTKRSITVNRCDVLQIDTNDNWVATWIGPTLSDLQYKSLRPGTYWNLDNEEFCIGVVSANP